jgi:hypothetical protein
VKTAIKKAKKLNSWLEMNILLTNWYLKIKPSSKQVISAGDVGI